MDATCNIGQARIMPLQNRVTPFGEIVAIPERGTVMGNRGIIHDPTTRTLLKRRWALKCWIICKLHYKHYHREPMAQRSWTELFFLDEATALAAGHRPCFFCNREKAKAFRAAWATGNGGAVPSAPAMDAVLHRERMENRGKRMHPLRATLGNLPDGTMVAAGDRAFLTVGGTALLWSPTGYQRINAPEPDSLLTPPSTVAALRAGYRPDLHPSVSAA
jgi:hypothetical protein